MMKESGMKISKTSLAFRIVLLALAGGVATSSANAATATTTFPVTATVQATCTISAGALAFGNYTGSQVDSSSTISVTCTNSTAYDVGLSEGGASGATVTTRQMANGSALLNYAMFRDASRTLNWGKTVSTDTLAGTGNGGAQSLTGAASPAGTLPTPGER